MDKKENIDASAGLKEAMMRLNEKLDKQLNGDVVNDTFVKHIKKYVENVVENHGMMEDMVKAGVTQEASEWLLFLFAVMNTGPLPKELQTVEFQDGVERFSKEHGLDNQKES